MRMILCLHTQTKEEQSMKVDKTLAEQVRDQLGTKEAKLIVILRTAQRIAACGSNPYEFRPIMDYFPNRGNSRGSYLLEVVEPKPKTERKPRTPKVRFCPPVPVQVAPPSTELQMSGGVSTFTPNEAYVPARSSEYVKWGEYANIEAIVASGKFFPTFISGQSGNGKTMMVEQVCANLGRQMVRVQISPETDETDLIGGFNLIDGNTKFIHGPVIMAMKVGAILLIDEIDRGSNKLMCLQGILEGKPVLIKKTGEIIHPAPGFNVVCTANTKGKGSDDGRFSAATIIDEAFLERFVIAVNQSWPSAAAERKIVLKHMEKAGIPVDSTFCENLVNWANIVRATFDSEGIDEVVSTRRICHIINAYGIFTDKLAAIKMCISRFDKTTYEAMLDLYTKLDIGVLKPLCSSDVNDNSGMQTF